METLWNKGVGMPPEVTRFTVGNDPLWDLRLAPYDVKGSMAHVNMLCKIGILTVQEKDSLLTGLNIILEKTLRGDLVIGEGVEDIHSLIELELSKELGDLGKKKKFISSSFLLRLFFILNSIILLMIFEVRSFEHSKSE